MIFTDPPFMPPFPRPPGVPSHIPDLAAVFRAEILAARLEGALRADIALAALWRGQAAVQEACASAWLEDLPVTPVELLSRSFRGTLGDPDRDRSALTAASFLRGLHSPGALDTDTGPALSRLWSLSSGEGPSPFSAGDHEKIRAALREARSPLLGALTVALIVNASCNGRAPSIERLAFVGADHALRGSGRFMLGEVEPHGMIAAPRGAWVMQPALALVDNGFRLWSITRPDRVENLIAGIEHTLDRGLGALPMLRRWLIRARTLSSEAHGASRLPDLIDLLMRRPIVTTGEVAKHLKVTPRGAQKLIDRSEELDLIAKITPRSTYRAWAVIPFARMLRR